MFELERAVARADGDGQAVDAGALPKIRGLHRVGQKLLNVLFVLLGIQPDDVFLDAAQHAELGLDHHTGRVSQVGRLLREGDVMLEIVMAAVDHDAGVAVVHALLDEFDRVAVIAVDGDRQVGVLGHAGIDDGLQVADVGVLPGAFADLQNAGRLFAVTGVENRLGQLHVVDVERPDGEPAVVGQVEHGLGGHQRHNGVLFHVGGKSPFTSRTAGRKA